MFWSMTNVVSDTHLTFINELLTKTLWELSIANTYTGNLSNNGVICDKYQVNMFKD